MFEYDSLTPAERNYQRQKFLHKINLIIDEKYEFSSPLEQIYFIWVATAITVSANLSNKDPILDDVVDGFIDVAANQSHWMHEYVKLKASPGKSERDAAEILRIYIEDFNFRKLLKTTPMNNAEEIANNTLKDLF